MCRSRFAKPPESGTRGLLISSPRRTSPLSDPLSFSTRLSEPTRFENPDWSVIPDRPGVYVILDMDAVIYVGMAGRNGRGSLRKRLQDHASGKIVNMFAQYLFLTRVQFGSNEPIVHPREAKAACRAYIDERYSFGNLATETVVEASEREEQLEAEL